MTDVINPQPAEPVTETSTVDVPTPEPQPTPEPSPTSEDTTRQRKGPGRPRVPEVVERDEAIFTQLRDGGPAQVRDLADATNYDRNKTYLSLWRLRKEGRVEYARHGAKRLWSVVEAA